MSQKSVSLFQAVYYLATGIWPVAHIQSFVEVSGPKVDLWLVKMVGLLTVSIGLTLFYAAFSHPRTALLLGIVSAMSYCFIDIYYSLNKVIPHIYLADAIIEAIIIILLLFSRKK